MSLIKMTFNPVHSIMMIKIAVVAIIRILDTTASIIERESTIITAVVK